MNYQLTGNKEQLKMIYEKDENDLKKPALFYVVSILFDVNLQPKKAYWGVVNF